MNENKISADPIWYPYTRFGSAEPVVIKSAYKEFLVTEKNEEIIDAVSSWWTNVHGHSHPAIVKAVSNQIATLDHLLFAGFTHQPANELASLLTSIVPGNPAKVFFSDNGSTAVEVAIKMSLQYWSNLSKPRKKIIAFSGSYHGDTFGAMSVSDRGSFTKPFKDLLFDVLFIDAPFPGKEKEAITKLSQVLVENDPGSIAAFIYEPLVMGTAGMRMYDPEPLDEMLTILRKHDIICIADEVMTGFARTGRLFASLYINEKPDIVCLSKGITGGVLPLGITTATNKIYSAFADPDSSKTFYHGHSYTGNPVSIAASVASTKLFVEGNEIHENTFRIEKQHHKFKEHLLMSFSDKLDDVRVRGTIIALDLKTEDGGYLFKGRDELYNHFLERGILLRPLGNVLYIMPPYCISDESLNRVYSEISDYLEHKFVVS